MKRKPAAPPDCLLKTIMQCDVCRFNSAHAKWGLSHERAACRKYYNYMKEENTHITVMRTGLIVHEDLSFLATIPDGIVQCTHRQPSQGLLEVKCLSVHRNDTPAQACEDKSFFCEAVNGTVTLKRNHNYFHRSRANGCVWEEMV